MKCSHIKKLLSQYLEGELTEKENLLVSEHLKICSKCAKELSLLKETVSLLKTKESVQPPPDFVIKIRKKIESRRWWKEALRLIFYPWHIKIPAEAIATILITCLVYYIYHQQIPPLPVPKTEPAPQIYTEEPVREIQMDDGIDRTLPKPASSQEKKKVLGAKKYTDEALPVARKENAPLFDKADRYRITEGYRGMEASSEEIYLYSEEESLPDEAALERKELFITLKNPKKDLLKIIKYLSLLNTGDIQESFNEETEEKIISFRIEGKDYLKLVKKLTKMDVIKEQELSAFYPSKENLTGEIKDIAVELKIK